MFFLRQDQEYRWVTTTHKGHWSFGSGPSYGWYHKQTFRDDGIPQISVEQDKHGVWPTTKHCNNESCAERQLESRLATTRIPHPSCSCRWFSWGYSRFQVS